MELRNDRNALYLSALQVEVIQLALDWRTLIRTRRGKVALAVITGLVVLNAFL